MISLRNVSLLAPIINYEQRSLKKNIIKNFELKNKVLLKNISLEIMKGEKIAIIGKNGSGKSTLLKLIGGVYKPTKGKLLMKEDNISLISELSAGISENLTGYDNILLKSIYLDLDLNEKKKQLHKIIKFSGLGENIYKIFKNYSDGMKIRLLLSISLFSLKNILLIDEIIGAGDLKFSKKTIRFLNSNYNKDKTMILASHDINLLKMFCDKGIYMKDGQIKFFGELNLCYKKYLKSESLI